MTDLGKIDASFFDETIYPNLGASRADVTVGPRHGVDFGVLDVGGQAVVIATDPVSLLPELGLERAGRFALEIVLTDVAVSGVPPTHLAMSLTLPPSWSDDDLATVWRAISDHAERLGVSIVSGHTARYPGIDSSWVGGATVLGVGDHDDVVRPDGATPGDRLVVTTGPAAEVTGLLSTLFPERLGVDAETVAIAQERVDDIAAVADARTAFAASGVTAMHDATEGGVVGGLTEMASGAGVRFEVDSDRMPVRPGVEAVCDALDVDPWMVTSAGTLLLTVEPRAADDVVEALRDRGTPAATVGEVVAGEGVVRDGERVHPPNGDPSWDAFDRLSGA
ncbi:MULTISPECIES: AIR synthase family protein [Halomicrobium]|uniref:AIR synthase related protein domain protein n=2 Tax=Halomicrobium mukohataei TaxID=57705 RepID=C7P4M7_HALMD|nr:MULTISPECIES: AIR synthase family protein [Halomicrobium]ACV48049.1 AIR synthase related protein domain protein [Halomicrobium mukohataei DSM 12286]QCD66481.1 hydrogenase expression protein [Halomicrobium mukohataei]QFR21287.1 hydrogenase expression protein [Halomicrobium sp. ZPS1]